MRSYDITLTCDHCLNEEHIVAVKARNYTNAWKRALRELGSEQKKNIHVYAINEEKGEQP